jgi:predicted secreted protein
VKFSRRALNALNRAFASFAGVPASLTGSAFEAQERDRSGLFRRTQFLS